MGNLQGMSIRSGSQQMRSQKTHGKAMHLVKKLFVTSKAAVQTVFEASL